MQLCELLQGIFSLPQEADCTIANLTLDSREIKAHDLFIALKGTQTNGRQFIPQAIAQGAAAVLVEADATDEKMLWQKDIPIIPIAKLQTKLNILASRFYHYPAKQLRLLGVTGTNGKTSYTHFVAQLLSILKMPCGIIGTLGSGMYGNLGPVGLTTPDPITLQALLSQMLNSHAKAVAMEVSSHSIDQNRIDGLTFEVGVFTNLTQDHLDYHGDMQTYAAVKRHFLADYPHQHLIINQDDAYGRKWIQELSTRSSIFAYSTQSNTSKVPLIYADQVELSLRGIRAKLYSPWGNALIELPLIGRFNLSNILAAITTLCVMGFSLADIVPKLSQVKSVPGRMQLLGGQNKPVVVVDFAHTPDALEKVLQTLRTITTGKLICVFGCGGDRDAGKRPIMANIAESLADRIIVTSDNPRYESPEAIANDILTGFSKPNRVMVELDRSKAIEKSIQCASTDDCVLIAGKGAEHYQIIANEKIVFDDVEEVMKHL